MIRQIPVTSVKKKRFFSDTIFLKSISKDYKCVKYLKLIVHLTT